MNAITYIRLLLPLFFVPLVAMCTSDNQQLSGDMGNTAVLTAKTDTATLGAGCFWCTEAVFSQIDGVISVTPGYSGGKIANPTYREVYSGLTGHAEVARIIFDPQKINFGELLEVFWQMHDPTSLNRQGADQGTQYRSVIFYHSEQQKLKAERQKELIEKSGIYDDPVVTEIAPAGKFYEAEDYHKAYYDNNMSAPYCRVVIGPKVEKIRKLFGSKIKYPN
jgi:peptide-methionine (S)-S-oxide reductase